MNHTYHHVFWSNYLHRIGCREHLQDLSFQMAKVLGFPVLPMIRGPFHESKLQIPTIHPPNWRSNHTKKSDDFHPYFPTGHLVVFFLCVFRVPPIFSCGGAGWFLANLWGQGTGQGTEKSSKALILIRWTLRRKASSARRVAKNDVSAIGNLMFEPWKRERNGETWAHRNSDASSWRSCNVCNIDWPW